MNNTRTIFFLPILLNIPFRIIGCIPIIVYLIVLAIMRVYVTFDNDEIEAVHTAWKIIHDGVIYRDFFQHHHPLLYYLLIPIVRFFGESLTTLYIARWLQFSFFVAAGYAAYLLAKLLWNDDIALLSIYLLYTAPIFQKILEIRPDGPQTAFAMFSLLYLFYFLQTHAIRYLVISGFTLSLAFLFLQKIIFLMFLIYCILFYLYWQKQIATKEIAIYISIITLPILFYIIYIVDSTSWHNYVKFNWILNIVHPGRFLPVHTLPILFDSQLLTVGYVFGMLYFLKTEYQKMIGFISIGLLIAAIGIVKFSFSQYYAPVLPLMAIIAASALYQLVEMNRTRLIILMACILIGPLMRIGWATAKHIIQKITNEQHKKIAYVWRHTKPEDFVYDGRTLFNLFRHDIHFFWFETRGKKESDLIPVYEQMTGDTYDIYSAINRLKPRIISNYYLDMTHPTIVEHYKQTEYNDIWIRKD